jgi:Calcineurin-like phosphoesterase
MFSAFRLLLLAGVICGVACESKHTPPPAPAPAPAPPRKAAAPDGSYRFSGADRVVAFGDVHGDVDGARAALRLAGAIDSEDDWIGGKLVVVQTGDLLDRGDSEPEVLDLFDRLAERAKKAGGAFRVLDGNHEIMNVAGDFRYVTPAGFRRYESTGALGASSPLIARLPERERGRARAFFPRGPAALRLAEHPIAIVVGDTAFVHGGLLPEHVRYGIERINAETRRWMRGEAATPPAILESENAPIWNREYSEGEPSEAACGDLETALELLHARRMVVGHTPQKAGISSGCGEKVWRIDVGLSHFYGGRPAVLEVRGDSVRVITSESTKK